MTEVFSIMIKQITVPVRRKIASGGKKEGLPLNIVYSVLEIEVFSFCKRFWTNIATSTFLPPWPGQHSSQEPDFFFEHCYFRAKFVQRSRSLQRICLQKSSSNGFVHTVLAKVNIRNQKGKVSTDDSKMKIRDGCSAFKSKPEYPSNSARKVPPKINDAEKVKMTACNWCQACNSN